MAYPGQTISNPITGERITFLKTTHDAEGQVLIFDCRVTLGGMRLPAHAHHNQEERITILSGALGVLLGGTLYRLSPGQTIVLPARIKHQWWNAGEDEVHFRVEVVPPHNLEAVLEAVCGMAQAGRLTEDGIPVNPFDLANLARLSEMYVPGVPVWLQKILLDLVSSLGRLLGHDPEFREYRASSSRKPEMRPAGSIARPLGRPSAASDPAPRMLQPAAAGE